MIKTAIVSLTEKPVNLTTELGLKPGATYAMKWHVGRGRIFMEEAWPTDSFQRKGNRQPLEVKYASDFHITTDEFLHLFAWTNSEVELAVIKRELDGGLENRIEYDLDESQRGGDKQ